MYRGTVDAPAPTHFGEEPVSTSSFGLAKEYLNARPLSKWGAIVFSIASSITLVLLIPIVYLFVELLVIPGESSGLQATATRNSGHWYGESLTWLASWNPWTANSEHYLLGLFIAAFLLVCLRGLFLYAAAHFACVASVDAAGRLRRTIYAHSYRLGVVAIHPEAQTEAGDLLSRRVEQILDGFMAALTAQIRSPILAVAALVIVVMVNLWVGLAGLFLIAATWMIAGQAAAYFRRDARLAHRKSESRLAVLRENLSLMQLVKSYLTERFSQARVERQISDLSKATRRRLRGETISRPTLYTVAVLAGLIVAFVAGRAVLGGELSLAGLVVQACAMTALVFAVNRSVSAWVRIHRAKEASANVFEYLDRRGDTSQPIDAEFLQPMQKKLELVSLSYREPGTGRMVLEGLSFTIPMGTRAAIICPDADESLTLAYLFTRFLEPTAGEIRIDGKNLRWVTFDSLRTQIAMVLTDHTTFSDTVANNIGCGDPSYSRPQIIEAAKTAHAHQFIQRLPYGYETTLGDSGHDLRPGERFRVALARAILRDPSILVIEEPSEPFDPDSATLIDDAMNRMQAGRTLIFLAKRSTTIKHADSVFVIQNGKLHAAGNAEELVSGSQVYRAFSGSKG